MISTKALPLVVLLIASFCLWALAGKQKLLYNDVMIEEISKTPEQPEAPISKTQKEWEKVLTPSQYHVLREAGTEPPHGKLYKTFQKHGEGTYYCAGCNAELFSSTQKFDSGSGWPSFFAPSKKDNIKLDIDYKIGYKRVEIKCHKCDGHLGHVFENEGYNTPTNQRYCVNGVCLKFQPKGKK